MLPPENYADRYDPTEPDDPAEPDPEAGELELFPWVILSACLFFAACGVLAVLKAMGKTL